MSLIIVIDAHWTKDTVAFLYGARKHFVRKHQKLLNKLRMRGGALVLCLACPSRKILMDVQCNFGSHPMEEAQPFVFDGNAMHGISNYSVEGYL